MADPGNDEKFDKGKEKQVIGGGQPIGGNDNGTGSGTPLSQGAVFGGEVATGQAQPGTGSEPPRSMGTRGTEFGQFGDGTGPTGQQGQSGTGQADLGVGEIDGQTSRGTAAVLLGQHRKIARRLGAGANSVLAAAGLAVELGARELQRLAGTDWQSC